MVEPAGRTKIEMVFVGPKKTLLALFNRKVSVTEPEVSGAMKLMVNVADDPGGTDAPLTMGVESVWEENVLAEGGTAPRLSWPTRFMV